MPTALIGAAITGGASLAGGLLNRKKTSTATATPTYTPEQQQLQTALSGKLTDRLNNPDSLDPLQTAAASGVNRDFDSVQTQLEHRLAARGFGASGKLATGTKDVAIKRAGALGDLESKFAALKIDQGNKAIDQAQQFAFGKSGTASTGTTPGDVLGGAVGGGAETATLLYALNHFMHGGDGATVGELPGGIPAGFDQGGPLGTTGY